MIKRLRFKLIAITMVLLTVMLAMVFALVYHVARTGLEQDSLAALQAFSADTARPGRPMGPGQELSTPCFVIQESRRDGLSVYGSAYFDLTDKEEIEKILEETWDSGQRTGVLKDRALRFMKLEGLPGTAYAFTDISGELQTLRNLLTSFLVIGFAALLGLFGISVLLARWAVRPVEKAWEQQRQFVADASHELKTPLTVILTNAELLRSEEYDEAGKRRFADSILTMSRQMRGLVEELLDQARVDNGAIRQELAPLDLSKLVSDAALPFEPVYFEEGRELRSEIEPGITMTGSARHLRQVVDILLDNGCKYSVPGGIVALRLRRQGRNCLLTVTSPGPTMSQEQCRDVFKRFYRADTARSMNHSYGLGLSIAQSIVQQHRGRIWAAGENGWNTFFVQLPL